jgi:hypothetical protein
MGEQASRMRSTGTGIPNRGRCIPRIRQHNLASLRYNKDNTPIVPLAPKTNSNSVTSVSSVLSVIESIP